MCVLETPFLLLLAVVERGKEKEKMITLEWKVRSQQSVSVPAPHPSIFVAAHHSHHQCTAFTIQHHRWSIIGQTDRYAEMVVNLKFPSIVIVIFHNDNIIWRASEWSSSIHSAEFPTNDNKVQHQQQQQPQQLLLLQLLTSRGGIRTGTVALQTQLSASYPMPSGVKDAVHREPK